MSQGPVQSTPPPARIHLLPAKEAPVVIVIRRKPSRRFHILRWNTETDEVESGSWFTGRIYEMRSDVSFDGEWMIYLAMGATGETWTGICQPPFLRTTVHWENQGTWHGGGVFADRNLLHANAGYARRDMVPALGENGAKLPFRVIEGCAQQYGEDEGVLYPRFERDGFHRVGPRPSETPIVGEHFAYLCEGDSGWICQPTPDHLRLRVRYRGYRSGQGRVFEFDLPEHPGLLHPTVSWAGYDSLGQLVFARLGVLYRYTVEGIRAGTGPAAVIDLEPLAKEGPAETGIKPATRPGERPPEPSIKIVEGPLEDQMVLALVLPTKTIAWADRVKQLAGDFLPHYATETGSKGPVFVTPGFYLRQHDLVHVEEPAPQEGLGALARVCGLAFEAAGAHTGKSVALRPIGLTAGWNVADAASATLYAAEQYVAGEEGREVVIVAEGAEERAILEALLTKWTVDQT
jgi:hypothetical protein